MSSHDHDVFPTIDWQGVANNGIKFAWVKATEAQNYVNPYFAQDYSAAKAAGILTGAYTYARPDKRDPVGDANFFIDNASWVNDSKTLVPFVDLEWPWFSGVNSCYNLTQQQMADWIQRFLDQVWLRIGRLAMIYTNTSWWNPCVGTARNFGAYPLDIANYDINPTNALPYGWTNWAIWQYAAGTPGQQGNYDKDVVNGDYGALQRLAGIDPPPPLTSKPVPLDHPPTQRLEVFANVGGPVAERFWNPTYGYGSWTNLGGNIVGTPTPFYNPRFGSSEVYARTASNSLAEKFWASGWSDWMDLGGDIVGDPAVMYNPRFGSTEVYARSSANHIVYKYYSNGWSPWTDLGGDIAGDPTVIYNPRFGTTEVYARTNSKTIAYRYYANGWKDWIDLGGDIVGDPSVMLNPRFGSTEVYARSSANHIVYKYYSNGWWDWTDLGGDIAGDPSIIYNPGYGTTEVYARSNANQIVYQYYLNSWSGWINLGGNATQDPSAIYSQVQHRTGVFINSGGNVYENDWLGSSWSGWINRMQ